MENHFSKHFNIKKVNHVKKYQDSSRCDEKSGTLLNELLFKGAASNEDFTPFGNNYNKWTATLEVNDFFLSFQIDTGAQANISPFQMFLNLQNCPK